MTLALTQFETTRTKPRLRASTSAISFGFGLVLSGLATAAAAQTQVDLAPVSAATTFQALEVGDALNANTQAVGNTLTVAISPSYIADVSQLVAPPGAQITAQTTMNDVQAQGASTVLTAARGNTISVSADGGVGVLPGSLGPILQSAGPGSLSSTTEIDGGQFGGLAVTSAAVGNSADLTSANGQVALGDSSQGDAGLAQQINSTTSTATLTLSHLTTTGAFTGEAQAVGNSASAGIGGAGVVASGLDLSQLNSADHTATATLANAMLLGQGNSLTAAAAGNVANFGTASDGIVRQTDTSNTVATAHLSDATVNGAFSATATGNAMSFVSSTADTLVAQQTSGAQTATLVGQRLVLNGPATFTATALGNQFTGTQPPGLIPGSQFQQLDSGAPPTASVNLADVSGSGDLTINATAIGNLATLSNPSGFLQSAGTGTPNATVTVSGVTASGGMSVSTTTLSNSVVIH